MRAALRAVALALAAPMATTEWTAKGTMRYLWATPVMEYDGLFNEVDCGVPWPSGGLTPSTRLASISQ